jgi:hypothetical protein
MRDPRDRRCWGTGAYLCGCVTLWIECSFRRRMDGGVLLDRTIGKFAKVMLYRARECLFAEYVMIGTLGSRSTPPPTLGFLWHLVIPPSPGTPPDATFSLSPLSFLLDCGLLSFSITDVQIGSLFVPGHYSLLFTTVAIYLNTLVFSTRIAQSALFSSGSFCHVSLLLHRRPCSSLQTYQLFPQSSFYKSTQHIPQN